VSAASTTGSTKNPTVTVNDQGHLVVTLRNSQSKAMKVQVKATATIGGKKVTLSSKKVSLKSKTSQKITLTVSKKMRQKLGHKTHALSITATPLTGTKKRATTLNAKIATVTSTKR
jgi:hypothetical protein